jgi:hypothetical protein
MRHVRTSFQTAHAATDRLDDRGGTALFYTMSGLFLTLFAYAIWYCPRHL